ncbi:MAG TPA: lytic polysaccharide monooxygenase [Streptosporangiaceae bacterium]
MTIVRALAAGGVPGLVLAALVVVPARPAAAHGALSYPMSRTMACGPEGGSKARSAACRAARAVSDPAALEEWDNLRVSGVAGRDRRMIPDGRLCSGGLDAYRGLDLPRRDWPATRLRPGARLTFRYRTTIPHEGGFRLYVTRDGYDPARPLRWSDLEPRPFATVTDPPIKDGAYVMPARLPRGKSGRHVIYTIWQNSSTPDTYYSCSDVVFGGESGGGTPAAGNGSRDDPAATAGEPSEGAAGRSAAPSPAITLNAVKESSHSALPLVAGGAAVVLVATGAGGALVVRRRRPVSRGGR